MNVLQVNYLARKGITMDEYEVRCLDDRDMDECVGPVDQHWNGDPNGRTWPRCTLHQDRREERKKGSMEQYANSDIAPRWFDPADAGERWDEDGY